MDHAEFSRIRKSLDLSLTDLCQIMRLSPTKGAQALREMDGGRRDMSGPISVIMDLFDQGYIEHLRPGGDNR